MVPAFADRGRGARSKTCITSATTYLPSAWGTGGQTAPQGLVLETLLCRDARLDAVERMQEMVLVNAHTSQWYVLVVDMERRDNLFAQCRDGSFTYKCREIRTTVAVRTVIACDLV